MRKTSFLAILIAGILGCLTQVRAAEVTYTWNGIDTYFINNNSTWSGYLQQDRSDTNLDGALASIAEGSNNTVSGTFETGSATGWYYAVLLDDGGTKIAGDPVYINNGAFVETSLNASGHLAVNIEQIEGADASDQLLLSARAGGAAYHTTISGGGGTTWTLASGPSTNGMLNGYTIRVYNSPSLLSFEEREIVSYSGPPLVTVDSLFTEFTPANGDLVFIIPPGSVRKIADNAITEAAIAADALTADKIATNALTDTKFATGALDGDVFSAAALEDLQQEALDALLSLGMQYLFDTPVAGSNVADNSYGAKLVSKEPTADFDDYDPTTDSFQALRDRGDAAWSAGTGLTPLASGTAQGGASTTIQLAAAETFADSVLNGQVVKITAGAGAGQARLITTYVGATDTATVIPAWAVAPASDSVYEVVPGPADVIALSGSASAADTAESFFGIANLTSLDIDASGHLGIQGMLYTLDALDAAQDAQHATTQASVGGLNDLSTTDIDNRLAAYDSPTKAELDAGFAALNDVSTADIDARLAAYDGPTKAEMDAGFTSLNDFDPTSETVNVGQIEGGDPTDQINAAADAAIADYDPPTRTEATTDTNSVLTKLLAYVQLLARSDAGIATDNAAELADINSDEGSGAGDYDSTADANEAIANGAAGDWTSDEREELRYRLGIDGTASAPAATPNLGEVAANVTQWLGTAVGADVPAAINHFFGVSSPSNTMESIATAYTETRDLEPPQFIWTLPSRSDGTMYAVQTLRIAPGETIKAGWDCKTGIVLPVGAVVATMTDPSGLSGELIASKVGTNGQYASVDITASSAAAVGTEQNVTVTITSSPAGGTVKLVGRVEVVSATP